jgi:hypothetical protein
VTAAGRHPDRRRRLPTALAAGLLATAGALLAAEPGADLSFERFNGSYSRPGVTMPPRAMGLLTVRLASPTNTLVLRSNRLRLTPLGDGSHRAEGTAEFLGEGWLVADLEMGGAPARLEDEVVIPPQTRTVVGRVRVAHGEQGFELTPVELPATVEVAIRSRLADRVVGLCDQMSLLPFTSLDCGGIEGLLSTAAVPLPAAGDTYLLPADKLTDADRRALADYLAAATR